MTPEQLDYAIRHLSDERLMQLYLALTIGLGLPIDALQRAIDDLERAVHEFEGFQA